MPRFLIGLWPCKFLLARQVAVGLSTFAIDLNQVAKAIRTSTESSLVLIDEFGKGTVSHDGAALLASCIENLAARQAACPMALFATHFHELVQIPTIVNSPLIAFDVCHT